MNFKSFGWPIDFSLQVVGRESLSTEICLQCVIKLRISYQFQLMCRKSSKILQGYLEELIGPGKIDPDTFVSSDLIVSVTPISNVPESPCKRKQRISKEQRCSLLKKLLTQNDTTNKNDLRKYTHPYDDGGGLRNIINFTRNYEFTCGNKDKTSLDKLTEFSQDFFKHDFSDFRNTILYIIENKDAESDDDDLFDDYNEEDEFKFDPANIKQEIPDCENDSCTESTDGEIDNKFVEPEIEIKEEESTFSFLKDCTDHKNNNSQNAMQLLDQLVNNYSTGQRKSFSPTSVRCRTRNNPYISPSLKQQFLYRNFKCNRCDRYFKSPGYLKAHKTKVHLQHWSDFNVPI